MKHLEFKTQIEADKKKVWDTMLRPETYKEWVNVSWPGSYYEGKLGQRREHPIYFSRARWHHGNTVGTKTL